MVYTYGEGIGEAFAHAKLAAEKAGLSLSYVNAIQMVDIFIPYFDMQEQIERLPGKNMEGQIEKLLADIAARKKVRVTIMEETKAMMRQYHQTLAETWLKPG